MPLGSPGLESFTGIPGDPRVISPSAGRVPFGATFDRRGHLLVSEIAGGVDGRGSVSSYKISGDGGIFVLDPSVSNFQVATCWIVAR